MRQIRAACRLLGGIDGLAGAGQPRGQAIGRAPHPRGRRRLPDSDDLRRRKLRFVGVLTLLARQTYGHQTVAAGGHAEALDRQGAWAPGEGGQHDNHDPGVSRAKGGESGEHFDK